MKVLNNQIIVLYIKECLENYKTVKMFKKLYIKLTSKKLNWIETNKLKVKIMKIYTRLKYFWFGFSSYSLCNYWNFNACFSIFWLKDNMWSRLKWRTWMWCKMWRWTKYFNSKYFVLFSIFLSDCMNKFLLNICTSGF